MKNVLFFLIFFAGLLSTVAACKKEKSKQDLLPGKWNAVSAVQSRGDTLVYDHENVKSELTLEFSEPTLVWNEVHTNKNTGLTSGPRFRGNYSWNNDQLKITLFPSRVGTAEVDLPNENTLHIVFSFSDNVGPYTVDVQAERQ